jgi:hypothetical protein
MYDCARNYNSFRRQEAQNELYFYWISHYDDEWRAALPLRFQGQFDQLRKAGRKIIADLSSNQIQPDFQPVDGTDDDMADIMDRMYRTDARRNDSREAIHNAINECIPCGIGAWRLITEYETDRIGDTKQVIRRKPIYEANARVFFDPAAKLIDKSDARYCQIISGYTKEDYEALKEDLISDGDFEDVISDFMPITSTAGVWEGEEDQCFVLEHYQRYKKKQVICYYKDLFGSVTAYYEEQVKDIKEELANAGYVEIDKRVINRWKVKKYIVSGEGILDSQDIVGTEIPIVPYYGERAYVDSVEHYEGITRLAQDPQRLRDFQLSYLADIVSTSPRPKAIFMQEQIAGFENMYEENGADNNYAYYLQNRLTPTGEQLPLGPVGMMPEQPIPQALIASIELMSQATSDVAQSGAPNSIADVNLSGNAVAQISAMLDEQSKIYQEHLKYAIRRDAEIYVNMVPDTYDVPRKVTLTGQNGTREEIQVMQSVLDIESGEVKVLNDLRTAKFDVYAEIGLAYDSQKQQQRQELTQLLQTTPPDHPLYDAFLMKYVQLSDGVENKDLKEYVNKRMLLNGYKQPENEEEQAILDAEANKEQQPDANMALAMAEMEKAKADQAKVQVDMFNAETQRMKVMLEAQKLGIDIDLKQADLTGKQIDNMQKLRNPIEVNANA